MKTENTVNNCRVSKPKLGKTNAQWYDDISNTGSRTGFYPIGRKLDNYSTPRKSQPKT